LDNYAKKWDAIGKKIEKLKEVSNQPESKGMFGTLGRDIGSVEQRMEDFSKEFIKLAEELSKTGIHILDKAEIEKVNKLTSALEALEKAQKNTQSAIDSKTKERQGVLNRKADAERRKAFFESE
jgi:transcriptional regulator of heat shock response